MFCDDDDEMATVYDYIIDAKVFFNDIPPVYMNGNDFYATLCFKFAFAY